MDISINISQRNNWDYVQYSGPINEEAEVYLSQLLPRIESNVVINLAHVNYINSCGVRGWINFMRELDNGRQIVLQECTPEIIMQINMIPSFKGKAQVGSLYASYFCDACGHEANILFETGKNMPKSPDDELATVSCPSCSSAMEMQELEEDFFAFLEA